MNTNRKSTTKNSKGLQRLTESEKKIQNIFSLEKVTQKDIEDFTTEEMDQFNEALGKKMNGLQGAAYGEFYDQFEEVLLTGTKNQLWEFNHQTIMWAISTLTKETCNFPPVNLIAVKTGLSRTTIYKHINSFKEHRSYKGQKQAVELMADKILWQMYSLANDGDVKAARLFLEVAGKLGKSGGLQPVQNQNNYIQINNTVVNQQVLQQLSTEQLNTIEGILKTIDVKEVD